MEIKLFGDNCNNNYYKLVKNVLKNINLIQWSDQLFSNNNLKLKFKCIGV